MKKKRLKKPGKGPKAHGAIQAAECVDYGSEWMKRGIRLGATTKDCCAYYKPKDIRALAEWLLKAADWVEEGQTP